MTLSWPMGEREEPESLILVGQVLRPHGLSGEVVVESHSSNPDRFVPGGALEAELAAGERVRVVIERSRFLGTRLALRFVGFGSRSEVERFRGARLLIHRSDCPRLEDGRVYQFELLGCLCSDRREGILGVVDAVLEDGGGWILVVRAPDRSTVLLPFAAAYLEELNLAEKRLTWKLPEGLVDTCRSRS